MTVTPVGTGQTTVNHVYCFDNANRLTSLTQGGTGTAGLSYDSANRRSCLTLPNGVITSYGYDNDSRVTSITYGNGGSCTSPPSNLGNLTYSYDADGRRLSMGGSLAAVTLPSNVSGGTKTTYNADNEQTKFSGTSFTFDANGNLTGDGTYTYIYGNRNQLNQIKQGGTVVATIAYDGLGRRRAKVTSTATQYLYDWLNPVQELNGATPPAVTANLLTGLGIDEYFTRKDSSGNLSSFLRDALGSTVGLVGSARERSRRAIPISRSARPRSAAPATATYMNSPGARTTALLDCITTGHATITRRIKDSSRRIPSILAAARPTYTHMWENVRCFTRIRQDSV
jgi:YD repeat-containing protein